MFNYELNNKNALMKYKIESCMKKEYSTILNYYIHKVGYRNAMYCHDKWKLSLNVSIPDSFTIDKMNRILNFFKIIEENERNNIEEMMNIKFRYLIQINDLIWEDCYD